jgi:LysR family cys regulon transcriptional activator
MHQGSPIQIAEMAADGGVDFALATEGLEHFADLVMMPCYDWNRCIVVPRGHPLGDLDELTLAAVAEFPIVTYVFGFTGRSKLDDSFSRLGLVLKVVFTATDADAIKVYVRLGVLARMAYDERVDSDLVALDASHLFEPSTTMIGCRRGTFLRGYMYDFIEEFAPHLTRERVDLAFATPHGSDRDELFQDLALPLR